MADLYRDDADFGEPLDDQVLDPIWNWVGGVLITSIVVGFLTFEMSVYNVGIADLFGSGTTTTAQYVQSDRAQK
jgi:hypothetical protein